MLGAILGGYKFSVLTANFRRLGDDVLEIVKDMKDKNADLNITLGAGCKSHSSAHFLLDSGTRRQLWL